MAFRSGGGDDVTVPLLCDVMLNDDDFDDGRVVKNVVGVSFPGSGVGGKDVDCSELMEWL